MASCQMKYVLVDWEVDHSVSVVPSSRLKSRDGANVVQKWPDGDYRGVILEESDKKKELEKRSKELCEQNSPRKSAEAIPPLRKRKTPTQKKTKKKPASKLSVAASQKLAEIQRANSEAEWMFGQGEGDSGSDTNQSGRDEDSDLGGLSDTSMHNPDHTGHTHKNIVHYRKSPKKRKSLPQNAHRSGERSHQTQGVAHQHSPFSFPSSSVSSRHIRTSRPSDVSPRISPSAAPSRRSAPRYESDVSPHISSLVVPARSVSGYESYVSPRISSPAIASRRRVSGYESDVSSHISPPAVPHTSHRIASEYEPDVSPSIFPLTNPRAARRIVSEYEPDVSPSISPPANPRAARTIVSEYEPDVSPSISPPTNPRAARRIVPDVSPSISPPTNLRAARRIVSGYETDISRCSGTDNSIHSPGPSSRMSSPLSEELPMELTVRVEKPRMVELVEGLGVYVPAHKLLSAVRSAKNSASALLRQLMSVVFSVDELATSSVKGKGNRRPALDPQKMEAIMGYVLSKFPSERAEYLVRQANDKLARIRSKVKAS